MPLDNSKRIALITGANRGIGFETTRQLATRGFHVVIAARDPRKAHQAAEKSKHLAEQRALSRST
jgi:NAD(P)-dependent dehydrogenase (short-subunit alcohol dehydrogenase family)